MGQVNRRAGNFNRLITIERQGVAVSDGAGGITRGWVVVAEGVWMDKQPVSAQRVLEWNKIDFTKAFVFLMYYREDIHIAEDCRLREGDTLYTIHNVTNKADDGMVLEILAYTS